MILTSPAPRCHASRPQRSSDRPLHQLRAVFRVIDHSGNGAVNAKEWAQFLSAKEEQITQDAEQASENVKHEAHEALIASPSPGKGKGKGKGKLGSPTAASFDVYEQVELREGLTEKKGLKEGEVCTVSSVRKSGFYRLRTGDGSELGNFAPADLVPATQESLNRFFLQQQQQAAEPKQQISRMHSKAAAAAAGAAEARVSMQRQMPRGQAAEEEDEEEEEEDEVIQSRAERSAEDSFLRSLESSPDDLQLRQAGSDEDCGGSFVVSPASAAAAAATANLLASSDATSGADEARIFAQMESLSPKVSTRVLDQGHDHKDVSALLCSSFVL